MGEYRIYGLSSDGCITQWSDVQCDDDQTALLLALDSLKPGAQAEVWAGESLVGAASLPMHQPASSREMRKRLGSH
jgi:hypothetical protein